MKYIWMSLKRIAADLVLGSRADVAAKQRAGEQLQDPGPPASRPAQGRHRAAGPR